MLRRHFISTALSAPLVAALQKEKIDEAEDFISKHVNSGAVESASLHVRQGATTRHGKFNLDKGRQGIFLLASISKPMTAAGVMLLSDRGELALDDKVRKFIPEFREGDRSDITMRHLLTHTSGLPDQLPANVEMRKRNAPLSEFVEGAIRTPLLFKPGQRYKYQSMGILLAAEVCQRITTTPFPDYLAKVLYAPLGMKHSAMGLGSIALKDTERSQVEKGPPHSGLGKKEAAYWDWNSPYWRNLASPWGGAHATAADVALFFAEFLYPDKAKVLKPETARLMVRNHTPKLEQSRGLGFALGNGAGTSCSPETFWHGGATGTLAWADPTKNMSFVLLTTLPSNVANKLVLKPASDIVSEAG